MNLRKKETQKEGSTNHGPVTKTLRSLYLHFREKDRRCIQVYLGNPQIVPQTAGRLPKGDLFLLIFQLFWNKHLWWRFCSASCSVSTLEHSVFLEYKYVFFLTYGSPVSNVLQWGRSHFMPQTKISVENQSESELSDSYFLRESREDVFIEIF